MRLALFVPCFVDVLAPVVGLATARVLERLGHEVVVPSGQTCCGQPALNAGHLDDAAALARRLVGILEKTDADAVVSPSGSCVAALRVAGRTQLSLESGVLDRLFELSELLTERLGLSDVGATFPGRVTWHDACHPSRELGIRDGPRRLLGAVAGLELVEMAAAGECCGFGGTFAVKLPELSVRMGVRKIQAIEDTGADVVASTESSCLFQIEGLLRRKNSRVRALHLAEILAEEAP